MTQHNTDIVIIGSGMAGLSFAALIAQQGFAVTVIDRIHPEMLATEKVDARTVALSAGSRDVLAPLGIWDQMVTHAAAITSIDVQEGHDPFLLNFDAKDTGSEAFGWIFPNTVVRQMLYETALKFGVTFIAPAVLKDIAYTVDEVVAELDDDTSVHAKLLIGADGRFSRVRDLIGVSGVNLSYDQTALVGLVEHEMPHQGLAVERFYSSGPFAILPFVDQLSSSSEAIGQNKPVHRSAIVWTTDDVKGKRKAVPDLETITQQLLPLFDDRYGAVQAVGTWAQFPLSLYHAKSFIADRVALISDAAHAIHPIAGQGLNLGMRDVTVLVEELVAARDATIDIGSADILQRYQQRRRFDVFAMVAATDVLNRLFGNKLRGMRWLRSAGLGLVNRLPPLKRFFAKTAMGQ
jgi:2-octaprenyl-6-methoxyphenol hydroxylase